MTHEEDAILLRVFCGESDQHQGRPVSEAIVLKARDLHLAGATVVRGIMGYGRHATPHRATLFRLGSDLPVIVELVDTEAKLHPLLAWLEENLPDGLATTERVGVLHHGGRPAAHEP